MWYIRCVMKILYLFFGLLVSSFAVAESGMDTDGTDDTGFNSIYISGGHPFGLRFATAGAVCVFVSDTNCHVSPSTDSLKGLELLFAGESDMAIVQSDFVNHAADGTSRFKQIGANPNLRTLAVLGVEMVMVAVRKSANINSISDLNGRALAIGVDKTYRGLFGKALLKSVDISQKSVSLSQYDVDKSVDALCSGKVDASVFISGNPNNTMDILTAQCDVVFLSLSDTVIDKIQKSFKGVFVTTIAPDTYWNQPNSIKSVGLYTVLVTTSGLDSKKAEKIQSAIHDNIPTLQTMHPTFSVLNPTFIKTNVGVPYYTKPVN